MRIGAVVLVFVSAALLDCATLNPLAEGTCGNGVVDATEDCDGFAPAGAAKDKCGAPGDGASACRLKCASTSECPEGWGCAVTGICREPSGKFGAIGEGVSAGVETMVVGDFDGDRRKDVLGSGPQGASGAAKVRVHYFAENGTLARVHALSAPISSPSVRDFNKDGVDDFAFGLAFGALGVMSGQLDRSLVPAVFPSARIPRIDARPVIAYQEKRRMPTGHSFDYFFAGNVETKTAGHKNVLSALAPDTYEHDLPVGPEGIIGDPVWAPFFSADPTSTCGEIAIAMKGATGNGVIQVFSPCAPGVLAANSLWAKERSPAVINPPLPLDGGIHVFSRTPGAPPELLFGTKKSDGTTVVYLVRSNGTSFGTPSVANLPELPIASGDLDLDGLVDFILPTGIAVSNTTGTVDAGADAGGGTPVSENFDGYVVVQTGRRVRWTSARVGQFNGDNLPDFIAASDEQPDIDFFSASPGGYSSSTISTSGPVSRLAIGDYDGDRLLDIGFVQQRSGSSDEFDVAIAYGRPYGPPEPPSLVGRTKKVVFFAPASDPDQPEASAGGLTLFIEEKAADGDKPDLALAIILANGDRQPIAPLFLGDLFSDAVTKESNPDVQREWVPFEVHAGPTRDPNRVDIVAVAVASRSNRFNGRAIDGPAPAAVWLAEGRGGTAFDAPEAIQEIGLFSVVQRQVTFEARTAVGDIDNPKDGTNEFVVIQRRPGESSFALRVARPGPESDVGLVALPDKSIRRDAPMVVTDVDGDGHADTVALLDEGTKRRVVVFYNDGKAGFGSTFVEVPLPEGEEAQGFAQIATRGAAPFGTTKVQRDLAIVTTKRIVLATPGSDRAVFQVRDLVSEGGAPLGRPTSIARGDFDGDGVDDLAIADSGALRILRQLPVKR